MGARSYEADLKRALESKMPVAAGEYDGHGVHSTGNIPAIADHERHSVAVLTTKRNMHSSERNAVPFWEHVFENIDEPIEPWTVQRRLGPPNALYTTIPFRPRRSGEDYTKYEYEFLSHFPSMTFSREGTRVVPGSSVTHQRLVENLTISPKTVGLIAQRVFSGGSAKSRKQVKQAEARAARSEKKMRFKGSLEAPEKTWNIYNENIGQFGRTSFS